MSQQPLDVLLALLGREAEEEIPICSQEPGGTGLMVDWIRADQAGDFCATLAGQRHCWFGVQPTNRPQKGRGTSKNVTGLVALYCDIDFASDSTTPGKDGGAGVERERALDVIAGLTRALGGVVPHAIVQSGYGLQPYWAIERTDPVDGALLLVRWKQVVAAVCDDMDIKLDMGVYDLPRILRVPGPPNLKHDSFAPTGLVVKHQSLPLGLASAHDSINAWFAGRGTPGQNRADRDSMRALMSNPGERGAEVTGDRIFTDQQALDFLEEFAFAPARETPWGSGSDYWKVLWFSALAASHFVDMYAEEDLAEKLRDAIREGHGEEPNAQDDYQISLGFLKGGDWLARRPTEAERLNPFSNARDERMITEKQGGLRAAGTVADDEPVMTKEVVWADGTSAIGQKGNEIEKVLPSCPFSGAPIGAGNLAEKAATLSDKPQVNETAGLTGDGTGRRLVVTKASQIKMAAAEWLWRHEKEHWLPLGGLVLFGGREGIGKSTWVARIVKWITLGESKGDMFGTPRNVIICATEDAWDYTITPRLMAAGADLDRVFRVVAQSNGLDAGLSLDVDLKGLTEFAEANDVALIVLDPLITTMGDKINENSYGDVYKALSPLATWAADHKITVVGLIHQSKREGTDLLGKLMGSRGFASIARCVLACVEAPDEDGGGDLMEGSPRGPRQFRFGQLKNNIAAKIETSVLYELEGCHVGADPKTGKAIWSSKVKVVNYGDETSVQQSSQQQEAASRADGRKKPDGEHKHEQCAIWLRKILGESERASVDLKWMREELGFSQPTMSRALASIGAQRKGEYRAPIWYLPEEISSIQGETYLQ